MAKISQKEYLKKYLADGRSDHRRKKKREYSDSHSSRVKIIDDNIDVSRRKAYDDDYDLILTGEDAPQIVGIVDDRPPELKTIEDFRSSGKWKSVNSGGEERHRHEDKYRDDYRQESRYGKKRSKTPERDYSPKRKNYNSDSTRCRRRSIEDPSPPRRPNSNNRDQRNQPANYYRTEKSSSFSDQDQGRKMEKFNPFRSTSTGYRDSQSSDKDRSISRASRSDFSPRSRVSMESKSAHSTSRQNPFKTNPTVQSEIRYADNARKYEDTSNFNPFKRNIQQQPDYKNSRSPARGNGMQHQNTNPRNPFRTNEMPRLSPLPEKRVQPPKSRNPFKPEDKSNQRNVEFNDSSYPFTKSFQPPTKGNTSFRSNKFNPNRDKRNEFSRSHGNGNASRENNRMQGHRDVSRQNWESNNSNKFRSNNANYSNNGQQKSSNNFMNRDDRDRRSQMSNFRSAGNFDSKPRHDDYATERNTNTTTMRYNHPQQQTEVKTSESRKSRWDNTSF